MNQLGAQLTKLRTDLSIAKQGEGPADKERAERIQEKITRLEGGLKNVAQVAESVAGEQRKEKADADELRARPSKVAQALHDAPNIDEDRISLPKVGSIPESQELQEAGAKKVAAEAKEPTDFSGRAKSQFTTRDTTGITTAKKETAPPEKQVRQTTKTPTTSGEKPSKETAKKAATKTAEPKATAKADKPATKAASKKPAKKAASK